MKYFLRIVVAALLLSPVVCLAQESWMLSFPEISANDRYAFFSGPKWTAVYSPHVGNMITLPRDSLQKLPPPATLPLAMAPSPTVVLDYVTYRCQNNSIVVTRGYGSDSTKVIPPPTSEMIACLQAPKGKSIDPSNLTELAGPAATYLGTIWFGLSLTDNKTGATVAGLGWFDPASNRFRRLYSPGLAGFKPKWVGGARGAVNMLLAKSQGSKPAESMLVEFDGTSNSLVELNVNKFGIPGKVILTAESWGDTLLLATDVSIIVWKPGGKPKFWASAAYASPGTCWLYLRTFENGDPGLGKAVQFLPLKSNTPTEVKFKSGRWLQVVSPLGIEGYVTPGDWEKHGVLWSQKDWTCGDKPCFARVRVKIQDRMVDADFTNTMLTYLGRDANGVKIGFKAAWAREEDMVPVMMGPP